MIVFSIFVDSIKQEQNYTGKTVYSEYMDKERKLYAHKGFNSVQSF